MQVIEFGDKDGVVTAVMSQMKARGWVLGVITSDLTNEGIKDGKVGYTYTIQTRPYLNGVP